MHARLIFVTGADVTVAAKFLEDRASVIEAQKGFRQLAASGDRSTGNLSIISVWDSREDLEASDSALANLRQEGLTSFGGQMTVRVFEQVAFEVGETPPQPGCVLRLVTYQMDPSRIDENISWFKSEVLPAMMASPGVRAVRNLVDRETGEGRVGSVYSDKSAMESSEGDRAQRMAAAGERGIEFGEESVLEVLFGQMSTS
jgi:heme-degrading monooxygenase HmoA